MSKIKYRDMGNLMKDEARLVDTEKSSLLLLNSRLDPFEFSALISLEMTGCVVYSHT